MPGGAVARCRAESRPVYLEVPRDLVAAPCATIPHQSNVQVDPNVLEACISEVAERIAQAQRPVMLVGVEIRRFGVEKAVTELAQKLGIEVFTTFMGRGLLAKSGSRAAGSCHRAAASM